MPQLRAASLTLGAGDSFALIDPAAGGTTAEAALQFATSNKKVARVSAKGVIKAVGTGKATITVTAADGGQATCAVKVVKAPKSIRLNASKATLGFDAATGSATAFQLTATLTRGSASIIAYSGYSDAIVSVSADGLVTACGIGTTTVTARTCNGKKAKCRFTVLPGPERLRLECDDPVLLEQMAGSVRAVAEDGAYIGARYESADPQTLAVDAGTGALTALRAGETTVTATAFNGAQATCAVTVAPGPEEVALSATSWTLGAGDRFALVATPRRSDDRETDLSVQFSTSNRRVAMVSADGVVKAVRAGKATITATAANGVQASCAVRVVNAPSSIELNARSATLEYDPASGIPSVLQLEATVACDIETVVRYSGFDPLVIDVSESGLVTAVGYGVTTVTASTYNGKKARCKVRVLAPDAEIADCRAGHPLLGVAHRGGRGYWPENTLEAFSHTESTGVEMVELDARSTADGVQVVHHDASFKANGRTYVLSKCSWAKLKAAKPEMCTLDEALELLSKTGLVIELEMKNTANVDKCMDAVERWGLEDRVCYISFLKGHLKKVRRRDPKARLGLIFQHKLPRDLNATIDELRLYLLSPRVDVLTNARLRSWHKKGLLVNAWPVNSVEECMAYAKMGVDMITSDYPDYIVVARQALTP